MEKQDIHTYTVSNSTGGLNKCQVNSTDTREDQIAKATWGRARATEGVGPSVKEFPAQRTTLKATLRKGAHAVGPRNKD